jgi:hypothetical protein
MLLALAGILPVSKKIPSWQAKGWSLDRAVRSSGNMPDEASRMRALPAQDSIANNEVRRQLPHDAAWALL